MCIAVAFIHVTLAGMNNRLLLPVFAATLFVSAFLIFAVQPMIGKMLLPLLGGSPSVWNTAMVFFQGMLLAGYAYAHFIARYLPLKAQGILHFTLLIIFTLVLPLTLPAGTTPPEESGQAWWQLGTMMACIGGPFFILAASAPLFQHWFAASGHDDAENPYFLYAVSNAGSMAALLGYPVLIEPVLSLTEQTHVWFGGYILLIALTSLCAILVRSGKNPVAPLSAEDNASIGWKQRGIWIFLAFIPSSLMLGVTTFITTDVASAPFLWVVPLALYLATFIIAFSRKPFFNVAVARQASSYLICLIILLFITSAFISLKIPMMFAHLLAFFFCAMLCHGELAESKPASAHLTEYFLLISFGGVLGGIFNALLAPKIFMQPLEYSLVLAFIPFVIWAGDAAIPRITGRFNAIDDSARKTKLMLIDVLMIAVIVGMCVVTYSSGSVIVRAWGGFVIFVILIMAIPNRFVYATSSLIALLIFLPATWDIKKGLLEKDRNYFGILKVYTKDDVYVFQHGTTVHGAQLQDEKHKLSPITYYSEGGPASDTFKILDKRQGEQKIAVLGLGVGSVACYKKAGRGFDFYEIDSGVVKIAENPKYFTYLSDCGSPYKIILGDARSKIQSAPDHHYDLIFIDAFSSDNIPIHVMTKEAFDLYFKKLKPDGLIVMNITNRYFDLRPVLAAMADSMHVTSYFKMHIPDDSKRKISRYYAAVSSFAVIAKRPQTAASLVEDHAWEEFSGTAKPRVWTDDYANIFAGMPFFQ